MDPEVTVAVPNIHRMVYISEAGPEVFVAQTTGSCSLSVKVMSGDYATWIFIRAGIFAAFFDDTFLTQHQHY